MRHFHLTKNQYWSKSINVDKLWTLVPKEEKDGLTESSDVVPVIDVLAAGYTKVLGNGLYVYIYILPNSLCLFFGGFISLTYTSLSLSLSLFLVSPISLAS